MTLDQCEITSATEPARSASGTSLPLVSVVIPTRDRPALVRRAVDSVVDQDYPGNLEVVVVFDGTDPDVTLERDLPGRRVSVTRNSRAPGLAGARNTGILAASGEIVAFCDDDDHWVHDKLSAQVAVMREHPDAEFVTTAMTVDYDDRSTTRLAGCDRVSYDQLLRSRMAMLHSSSFVIRRAALLDGIGLVDETLPRSMAEDWELLLRAARRRPIFHVDRPLINVTWGSTSYFADQWHTRNEARLWLLEHYPDIAADRQGAALQYGKLAFGHAAVGRRRDSLRWAARAFRRNPREPRTVLALMVVTGLVRWETIVTALNKRGRGI